MGEKGGSKKNWARLLSFTVVFAAATFSLIKSSDILFHKFLLDYGEGVIINFSNLIASGKTYFVDVSTMPFLQGAYPPAFPVLLAFVSKILPNLSLLFAGRLLTFIFSIGIFYLIYKIIKAECPESKYSLLFAGLFIASPIFAGWSSLLRVDMLAVFLSLLGIYIFRKYPQSLWRFLSAPVFALAFYTKQSALLAPAALAIYLLINNRRDFMRFVLIYGGLIASTFYFLNQYLEGRLFLHLFKYMGFTPLFIPIIIPVYLAFFMVNLPLFYIIKEKGFPTRTSNFYFFYLALSMTSIITIGKPGSNLNYLIEPLVALLLYLGSISKKDGGKIMLVALASQALVYSILIGYLFDKQKLIDTRTAQRANEYISEKKGLPILSEEPGYLSINKQPVLYEPFQLGLMGKFGLWDSSKIVDLCNRKYFSLAIVGWRIKDDKNLYDCILRNYDLKEKTRDADFFVPD